MTERLRPTRGFIIDVVAGVGLAVGGYMAAHALVNNFEGPTNVDQYHKCVDQAVANKCGSLAVARSHDRLNQITLNTELGASAAGLFVLGYGTRITVAMVKDYYSDAAA